MMDDTCVIELMMRMWSIVQYPHTYILIERKREHVYENEKKRWIHSSQNQCQFFGMWDVVALGLDAT
jgi:hypothetical protein